MGIAINIMEFSFQMNRVTNEKYWSQLLKALQTGCSSLLVAIVKEKDGSSWMTTVLHLTTWTAVVVAAPEVAER